MGMGGGCLCESGRRTDVFDIYFKGKKKKERKKSRNPLFRQTDGLPVPFTSLFYKETLTTIDMHPIPIESKKNSGHTLAFCLQIFSQGRTLIIRIVWLTNEFLPDSNQTGIYIHYVYYDEIHIWMMIFVVPFHYTFMFFPSFPSIPIPLDF